MCKPCVGAKLILRFQALIAHAFFDRSIPVLYHKSACTSGSICCKRISFISRFDGHILSEETFLLTHPVVCEGTSSYILCAVVQVQNMVETCQEICSTLRSTIIANRNSHCSNAKVSTTSPLLDYDLEILILKSATCSSRVLTVYLVVQKGGQELDYCLLFQ